MIGSHQSQKSITDEWFTPPEIISELGPFDLDVCSSLSRPWDTAKRHYTKEDDGLKLPWQGRVWCNPPYGQQTGKWLKKMHESGVDGIAMIFARTETKMFFEYVWNKANAILFVEGRIHFYNIKGERAMGNSGGPSCLVSYGRYCSELLSYCSIKGKYIRLR